MRQYVNEATSRAPREVVWSLLADHAGMSRWARTIVWSRRDQDGDGALDGVGAVRRMLTLGGPVREVVTVFEAPTRLAYRLRSGMPFVTDYQGETTLLDRPGGGTTIRWTVSFTVPPVVGGVLATLVSRGTAGLAHDLARAADARVAV